MNLFIKIIGPLVLACGSLIHAQEAAPPAMILAMETPVIKVDGKPFGEAIRILLDEFHKANEGTAKFVIDDAKIVARPENNREVSIFPHGNESLFFWIRFACSQASVTPVFLPNGTIQFVTSPENGGEGLFERRRLHRSKALDKLLGIDPSVGKDDYFVALYKAYEQGRFPGEHMRPGMGRGGGQYAIDLVGTVFEFQLLEYRLLDQLYEYTDKELKPRMIEDK